MTPRTKPLLLRRRPMVRLKRPHRLNQKKVSHRKGVRATPRKKNIRVLPRQANRMAQRLLQEAQQWLGHVSKHAVRLSEPVPKVDLGDAKALSEALVHTGFSQKIPQLQQRLFLDTPFRLRFIAALNGLMRAREEYTRFHHAHRSEIRRGNLPRAFRNEDEAITIGVENARRKMAELYYNL